MIIGSSTGDLKKRNTLIALSSLDNLVNKVDKDYSSGNLVALDKQLVLFQDQEKVMYKAKCYKAHSISNEITNAEADYVPSRKMDWTNCTKT